MQRLNAVVGLGLAACLLAGCTPPPPRLHVDVPGVANARVEMSPGEPCTAPCTVALARKEQSGLLLISAPGYYPVRLRVHDQQLRLTAGAQGKRDEVLLRVPLEPRPSGIPTPP